VVVGEQPALAPQVPRRGLLAKALSFDSAAWVALIGAIVVTPFIFGNVGITLAQEILVLALLGVAVDVLHGYAGLPSFGQGAFFGASGYAAGELIYRLGWDNPWQVAVAAVALSALLAAAFGLIALRASALYFLLITFAFGQLLATMASQFQIFQTPGVAGITGITFTEAAPGVEWTSDVVYWITAAVTVTLLAVLTIVLRSPFGFSLLAIQEMRRRMEALGFNTWLLMYVAFVVSGAIAGVGGVLHAYANGIAVPDDLGVVTSAEGLLVILIGGSRRIGGPVLGAAVVVLLQYAASFVLPTRWPLAIGALYVVAAFWTKHGLAGLIVAAKSRATSSGKDQHALTTDVSTLREGGAEADVV